MSNWQDTIITPSAIQSGFFPMSFHRAGVCCLFISFLGRGPNWPVKVDNKTTKNVKLVKMNFVCPGLVPQFV